MPNFAARLRDSQRAQPTLSMPMIVKNEAETLEKCLRLARPHLDEIVIVDTGSTDGTRAIAKEYADTYDEIEWPDSFSKARNHSLDLVTGDYCVIVDGDEYIESAKEWQKIRRTIRNPSFVGAQLIQDNVMSGELIQSNREWVERLFLSHPSIRYEGRVHNQIHPAISRYVSKHGGDYHKVDVDIMHTGYALEMDKREQKYRARIELLKSEYENPRSLGYEAYYGYQLAVVYAALHEWKEAHKVFEEIDFDIMVDDNEFYARQKAGQAAFKLDDYELALQHVDRMLNLRPEEPVSYYLGGLILLHAGEVVDGILMVLKSYEVNDQQRKARFGLSYKYLLSTLAKLCHKMELEDFAVAFEKLGEEKAPRKELIKEFLNRLQTKLVLSERRQQVAAA